MGLKRSQGLTCRLLTTDRSCPIQAHPGPFTPASCKFQQPPGQNMLARDSPHPRHPPGLCLLDLHPTPKLDHAMEPEPWQVYLAPNESGRGGHTPSGPGRLSRDFYSRTFIALVVWLHYVVSSPQGAGPSSPERSSSSRPWQMCTRSPPHQLPCLQSVC